MENNCNHDCKNCGTCMSLDKNNSRVKMAIFGEGIGVEYWCNTLQRYMTPNLVCDYQFDKSYVIVTEKGIQRTRGNQHNVNNQ
jgi:hypothetical protein